MDISEKVNSIIQIIEDGDIDGLVDIAMDGGVYTIDIKNQRACFTINAHAPSKQIWLVSAMSGPYRFDYDGSDWIDRRGVNMLDLLRDELMQYGVHWL